jgi:hypothetical protein
MLDRCVLCQWAVCAYSLCLCAGSAAYGCSFSAITLGASLATGVVPTVAQTYVIRVKDASVQPNLLEVRGGNPLKETPYPTPPPPPPPARPPPSAHPWHPLRSALVHISGPTAAHRLVHLTYCTLGALCPPHPGPWHNTLQVRTLLGTYNDALAGIPIVASPGSTTLTGADTLELDFTSNVGHTLHTEWVVEANLLPAVFVIRSSPSLR